MRNLTMLTDLYELTMMYGYFKKGMHKKTAVFDMFFRKPVGESSYAVMAGVEQLIELISNLHFGPEDIEYLRSLNLFDETFLKYLADFHFTGEVYAIPEGTIVFPGEPLVRVKAEIAQAQLIETALLNIINHQTLIGHQGQPHCLCGRRRQCNGIWFAQSTGPGCRSLWSAGRSDWWM